MTSFSLIKVINYSKFLICCLTVSTAYITPNKLLTFLFTITRYISISECSTYTIVVYSAILIHSDYFNLSFLSHSISIQTSNMSLTATRSMRPELRNTSMYGTRPSRSDSGRATRSANGISPASASAGLSGWKCLAKRASVKAKSAR